MKPWFIYLLRCSNGCLYTGITTDVKKRLSIHNSGKGSAYVRAHLPARLVAFCAERDRSSASKMEAYVKSLRREEKLALARKWKEEACTPLTIKKTVKKLQTVRRSRATGAV